MQSFQYFESSLTAKDFYRHFTLMPSDKPIRKPVSVYVGLPIFNRPELLRVRFVQDVFAK
jgi:hypothetical protein